MPIVVVLSPTAMLALFLGAILFASAVFLAGVWAARPRRETPNLCESAECAETVELSPEDRRIVMQIPAPRSPVDEPTEVLRR